MLDFSRTEDGFSFLSTNRRFHSLKKAIEQQLPLFDIYQHYQNDAYFIQLSDLHLGKNKRQKGLARLYASLDELMPRLPSLWPVNILITGRFNGIS